MTPAMAAGGGAGLLDFGVLPPEVTSTEMYSGPGSGSMMVAASAWDALAAQVSSFGQGYASVIAGLQGESWAGSAAAAMAAAAEPFTQWATATGLQAERAASQLRSAAAAFETAHTAITPPTVVAANRTQLSGLIATNLLGQNAARIAAVEAAYLGMWAQNTQAMYGYAGSASAATTLTPFNQPPPTTNPAGQSAAVANSITATPGASITQTLSGLLAAIPQQLTTTGTSPGIPVPQWLVTDMGQLQDVMNLDDGLLFDKMRLVGSVTHAALAWIRISSDGAFYAPLSGGLTSAALTGSTSPAALASEPVLAGLGQATAVGRLSAPQSWATATPVAAVHNQLSPLAADAWETAPKVSVVGAGSASAMAPLAQAAAAKKFKRPSVSTILQVSTPRYAVPRHSSGG